MVHRTVSTWRSPHMGDLWLSYAFSLLSVRCPALSLDQHCHFCLKGSFLSPISHSYLAVEPSLNFQNTPPPALFLVPPLRVPYACNSHSTHLPWVHLFPYLSCLLSHLNLFFIWACELSVRNFIISEGTEPLEELRCDVTRDAVLDYK